MTQDYDTSEDFYEKPPVIEGHTFGVTNKESRDARYNTCKTCEDFIQTVKLCKHCKCFMPAKSWFSYAECPTGRWPC